MAKNLAELCLCPIGLWKVELVSNEAGYSAGAISKQRVKGTACLFLNAHSKIMEERNELK